MVTSVSGFMELVSIVNRIYIYIPQTGVKEALCTPDEIVRGMMEPDNSQQMDHEKWYIAMCIT